MVNEVSQYDYYVGYIQPDENEDGEHIEHVNHARLPIKCNDHAVPDDIRWKGVEDDMPFEERQNIVNENNRNYTAEQYKKMGIKIVDKCNDLMYNVILPDGWRTGSYDRGLWYELLDNKGRRRLNFFWKTAPWDSDAFVNFSTRYRIEVGHIGPGNLTFEEWNKTPIQGRLLDSTIAIYSTKKFDSPDDYEEQDKLEHELYEEVKAYVEHHWPDYANIHAYWD